VLICYIVSGLSWITGAGLLSERAGKIVEARSTVQRNSAFMVAPQDGPTLGMVQTLVISPHN